MRSIAHQTAARFTPSAQPILLQTDAAGTAADAQVLAADLLRRPARIAPRFLYDALGARLFDAICELPEYYPTRTEAAILTQAASEIAAVAGAGRVLIDLGAGNCAKAERLFHVLDPSQYVAIDLDVGLLRAPLEAIQQRHPELPVIGIGTDLTRTFGLSADVRGVRRLFFYPGSSIGNFDEAESVELLRRVRDAGGDDGMLLIGIDLDKPAADLQPAYDDALQVTAAFNRNILLNVNRVLGTDFDLADWRHFVRCPPGRVEMHLQALRPVTVRWADASRTFAEGECIHTENSHKYSLTGFAERLQEAGLRMINYWTDPGRRYAVLLAGVASPSWRPVERRRELA